MPHVTLTAEDVDGAPHSWQLNTDRLLNTEVMAVERTCGMTATQFSEALRNGSMIAVTALVWIARKRAEPDLKFDDVVFNAATVTIEGSEDETAEGKADLSGADMASG